MSSSSPRRSRPAALIVAALTALAGTLLGAPPAIADTRPAAGIEATVSTDVLPTAQIDGVAWTQLIVGNTVYVGGHFGNARPAGAAAGVGNVVRSNLLSYSLSTGVLTSFAPSVNGDVNGLAVSPDGTRVYAVGGFTNVNGTTRNRVVAFSTSTGAMITTWAPSFNNTVLAVTATATTVYLGGNFTAIGTTTRTRLAAVSASNGALVSGFAPAASGGKVRGVAVSPDQTRLVAAGSFTTLDGSGNPGYGLGAVSTANGSLLPFAVNAQVRDGGADAALYSLTSDGDSVYGTGYVFGGGGNLEGAFRATWGGALVWVEDCHGDTYSGAIAGSVFYIAGHPHYCGTSGGFPQTDPWHYQRGMAWSKALSGNVANNQTLGYPSWAGTPIPRLLDWWPDFNTGTVSGATQGPWSVAANTTYVVYGGEFTKVNNLPQQGLVRFAVSGTAPNRDGPRVTGSSFVPTVSTPAGGQVRVNWVANYDRDNEHLTYEVQRDGTTVNTQSADSRIWYQRPNLTFLDTGVPAGSHSYRIRVHDPFNNTVTGGTVAISVPGAAAPNKAAAPGTATAAPQVGTTAPDATADRPAAPDPARPAAPGGASPTSASDDFGRSLPDGWGTASSGGAWATSPAASGTFSVDQTGRLSLAAGRTATATLGDSSTSTADVAAQVSIPAPPRGGDVTAFVVGRSVGTEDYRASVVLQPSGALTLELQRGETTIASASVRAAPRAGAALQVRLQVTGISPTTLRVRTWAVGTSEPADWLLTATDATPSLQAPGVPGLGGSASATLTGAPASVFFDDFSLSVP